MQNKKVCIITTAHRAFDDRIFHKEGQSLVRAGYEVVLIAPHEREETVGGIHIIPLPGAGRTARRLLLAALRAYLLAVKTGVSIYHIHDPDLLPAGILLKALGGKKRKVIYDVHEDYGKKMLSKKGMGRRLMAGFFTSFEAAAARMLDYVVAADSNIKKKFSGVGAEVIGNYPPLNFSAAPGRRGGRTMRMVYTGGICRDRGSRVMIEMMKYLEDCAVELHLAGAILDTKDSCLFTSTGKVAYHGFIPWQDVMKRLADADAGLLLLQPTPSYVNCTGEGIVKLFEYMMAGLPVIVSDFPHLRALIGGIGCGICVDPADPAKVAGAVRFLFSHPEIREEMGQRGRDAVMGKYNWENEGAKLIALYEKALGRSGSRA
ncbi:MAG: glycosyltransferase family 4 protein [Nitrospiraceae bacterium]|nr:glycosyltransferase family 4 protein [Nitrospiraceae bacterium]